MVLSVNGNNEICLTNGDFISLVEKYMGDEARHYVEGIVNSYEDMLKSIDEECEELVGLYNDLNEEYLKIMSCSNNKEGD